MANYPIPEYLQDSHDGDEWAIAAILEGRVVALRYISDIAPELLPFLDTTSAEFVIKRWVQKAPTDLSELQALGNVSAGIVTAEGFNERWGLAEWKPNDQLPEEAAHI